MGSDDVSAPKPDPESVFLVLNTLGISPEDTVYIGDSPTDAKTASNAGVDFVGVTTGTTTKEELAKYPNIAVISSLSQILEI